VCTSFRGGLAGPREPCSVFYAKKSEGLSPTVVRVIGFVRTEMVEFFELQPNSTASGFVLRWGSSEFLVCSRVFLYTIYP
jgi:hypothetical protein